MKHTILHQDASAAAAFEDALREARDLTEKRRTALRRPDPKGFTRACRELALTRERLADLLLAAAVVSSDELDAAEAMLHGMRLAVPQDEMGH